MSIACLNETQHGIHMMQRSMRVARKEAACGSLSIFRAGMLAERVFNYACRAGTLGANRTASDFMNEMIAYSIKQRIYG